MNYKLEVIGFNIESCIIAQEAGADRIELCDNPADGGTTPSYGFIKAARRVLNIDLFPIIRPRGGDFLYSNQEFKLMMDDVKACKALDCDGIVTGILKEDGTIDKQRCSILVALAYPLSVTFHRSFDRTVDPFNALEEIIECGFERILTSGQKPAAIDGIDLIRSLIEKADDRIIIMPGSGVRSGNILSIAENSKAFEFHSSARRTIGSNMKFINKDLNEESSMISIDRNEIQLMKEQFKSINS